ncbi:Hypothetical predicted protein [Scomber scombrus]|uniref:Uncharacterized protein n=1 Tax=Scomber scombrus TaxID=13677 RepID=A0AAV1PIK5_SCOSC
MSRTLLSTPGMEYTGAATHPGATSSSPLRDAREAHREEVRPAFWELGTRRPDPAAPLPPRLALQDSQLAAGTKRKPSQQ